jgi:hypothetical protein
MSPRQNVNPSERRQRLALFTVALLLGLVAVVVSIAVAPGHVNVPDLHGLSRARVTVLAQSAGLKPHFDAGYSSAALGSAIAQAPAAGRRVLDGSTVRVVLSAGPAPVAVPRLIGLSLAAARALLGRERLAARATEVPSPGSRAGTVIRSSPAAGGRLLPGASVALVIAQAPRWRALTSFTGQANGASVPFRIRGQAWRAAYSMSYQGTCTFVLFCSGPSATVKRVRDGATIDSFSLDQGSGKTHDVRAGPGVYEISVASGSDTTRWSIKVEDLY